MINTSLIYIEKDGKYLMLHRTKKENDANKDKWIGIGGKLEAGESPFDCARREVKEETGLTVNELRYRGIVTFVSDEYPTEYMHLFHTKCFEGELKEACDEGVLEWIDKEIAKIWGPSQPHLILLPTLRSCLDSYTFFSSLHPSAGLQQSPFCEK